MKKVFRFKYDSIKDYIAKTAISFFYIPYVFRNNLTFPVQFLKFETNILLTNLMMLNYLIANQNNVFFRILDLNFINSDEIEFVGKLFNIELLSKLGLENNINNNVIILKI